MLPMTVIRGKKNPLYLGIPKRLKAERKKAGFTRQRLAAEASLSNDIAFRIEEERRTPGVDTVEKLANALKISPCWLAYAEAHPWAESDTPLHEGLPDRLKTLRAARKLSLNALGIQSDTSHVTVARVEGAQYIPGVDTVEKLAKALKVSPCWLAFGAGADPLHPEESPPGHPAADKGPGPARPGEAGTGPAPTGPAIKGLLRRIVAFVLHAARLAR